MKKLALAALMCGFCALADECRAEAEIVWAKTISRTSDRYCGWPTVCDAGNGEILVAYSGDRNAHVCPWGKVRSMRSKDGGETWSEPVTVCNTVLDDRDAGLLKLSNGELVLFWFTSVHYYENKINVKKNPDYGRHFEKLGMDAVRRDLGSFSRKSGDGGRTWSAPARLPTSAPHGGIQLADGRLMVVGNQDSQVRAHMKTDPEEKAFAGVRQFLVVAESKDSAASWHELARIPVPSGAAYEPHLVEGADGVLRCYVRTSRNLLYTESRDGGSSWTPLKPTSIPSWDSPPYLLRLKDGKTLLTYARRIVHAKDRKEWKSGVFARIGDENGSLESFEAAKEIMVRELKMWDMGYPSTVECADGSLLTVFYGLENSACTIQAVRWRRKK